MAEQQNLWCCGCEREVSAVLTDGREIYPHRKDLAGYPYWKCEACRNFVGCHHKTSNRTKPLGCIPTPEIKGARQHIHRILDPLWKSKRMRRGQVYSKIATALGIEQYHTAEIRSVDDARKVYRVLKELSEQSS